MHPVRFRVSRADAANAAATLSACEPTREELRDRAPEIAAAYNDGHNSAMLANTIQFSPAEVIEHYERMAGEGARLLLLYEGETFVGDADIRHIAGGAAELAILIASRAAQGRGLGARLAFLLHALAFRALGIERLYVTILPENTASLRLFARLGYRVDTSVEARSYVDDERDVAMSIAKETFERAHASALAEVVVTTA